MLRNVYDKVWVMFGNKPQEKIIYSINMRYNRWMLKNEISYNVVDSMVGTGRGNNEGVTVKPEMLFDTKQELIDSLK